MLTGQGPHQCGPCFLFNGGDTLEPPLQISPYAWWLLQLALAVLLVRWASKVLKVVAVCTPLEDPVWAMPGEMVTVGCADQTSGGQVVAGSVVLGSQNFALVPTAGQIWSSQIPAPSNPGVYIATLQLDVRDPKGRAVTHAVPIQLVVASPVQTPAEGLDVSGPLPGVAGKVRLVR